MKKKFYVGVIPAARKWHEEPIAQPAMPSGHVDYPGDRFFILSWEEGPNPYIAGQHIMHDELPTRVEVEKAVRQWNRLEAQAS